MIKLEDDKRKLTELDKENIADSIADMVLSGELSPLEGKEHLQVIREAKTITDLAYLMERFEELEKTLDK